ncbi:MAG: geranylgeranylglyceryl/heptaprenylglyceryl phosphate synthase [Bacteroidia bacterium]|nr:geranylgeranylglyceryl phosphate synthase family protein [Bacteroidia bacterium]MDW8134385.1 geranylgeranylglyceryl/heptaprenylglyceryl phosphate synthase [Bacteroidia bacterium]
MKQHILSTWRNASPQPLWLIDPDRLSITEYKKASEAYLEAGGRWALVGGSLLTSTDLPTWCALAKNESPLSLILFPGSTNQLCTSVEAVLLLFLASGRNPHYLIGAHVEAALFLHRWGGEVIPTTYILVGDVYALRAVHYITQTWPIPPDKPELIQATALAGLLLGQQVVYIDGGSGALHSCAPEAVAAVRAVTDAPILVGGGISSPEDAESLLQAGATFVVIGTAAEKKKFSRQTWEEFFLICTR